VSEDVAGLWTAGDVAGAELTAIRRKAEAVLTYKIKDAAARRVYWRDESLYRPLEGSVYFRMGDNALGTRIEMVFDSVHVLGKRLKKDGTQGLVDAREYFHAERMDAAPQWVLDLVAKATRDMEAADAAWGRAS
jgi:hypothetical protein